MGYAQKRLLAPLGDDAAKGCALSEAIRVTRRAITSGPGAMGLWGQRYVTERVETWLQTAAQKRSEPTGSSAELLAQALVERVSGSANMIDVATRSLSALSPLWTRWRTLRHTLASLL